MDGWRSWFNSKHTSSTTNKRSPLYIISQGDIDSAASAQNHFLCGAQLSECQGQDPKGGGGGQTYTYTYTYIYIYNSDSLYKVGEEKREGGTLLGHHTEDVA